MKTSHVLFANLTLFFVICASDVAIGMETDKLPSEINQLILTKVVRLVLDEAEDNPHQLMSRKKMNPFSSFFVKHITGGAVEHYESANNIDYIITLIGAKTIGADPNTTSYKGNNILHLLVSDALQTCYLGEEDSELQALRAKITLLSKYNLDFNAKNGKGNTIGHELIASYVHEGYSTYGKVEFIKFLQNLGMNISTVKNADGHTAYEVGLMLNNGSFIHQNTLYLLFIKDQIKAIRKQYEQDQLNKLSSYGK